METPQPIAFSLREGEWWYPWDKRYRVAGVEPGRTFPRSDTARFASIVFADGTVFDFVNGWRPKTLDSQTIAEIQSAVAENFTRDFP